jgi:gas vesicle protein
MKSVIGTLGAVALGAAAMYVLDPNNGKERRAKLKEKAKDFAHKEGEMLTRVGHDLKEKMQNRINGDGKRLTKPVIPVALAAGAIGAGMIAKRVRENRKSGQLPY